MTEAQVSPRVRQLVMFVDRVAISISKHWLLIVNTALFVFVGLPILAPLLMQLGYTGPAGIVYSAYRLTCHALAFRSFFFFGRQPVYTLEQLGTTLGAHGDDALYWSDFLGNPELGYKMAWCERDMAIYGSILVMGLLFGLLRSRWPTLDWRLYVLMILPMAIDGTWQLFTSPLALLSFLPIHESTWQLRLITGTLFGVGSVWLVYPYVQEAMRDIHTQTRAQLQRAQAHEVEATGSPRQRKIS